MTIKEHLQSFLGDTWNLFITNFDPGFCGRSTLDQLISYLDFEPYCIIDEAFDWCDSAQGWDYWNKVHEAWCDYCSENL